MISTLDTVAAAARSATNNAEALAAVTRQISPKSVAEDSGSIVVTWDQRTLTFGPVVIGISIESWFERDTAATISTAVSLSGYGGYVDGEPLTGVQAMELSDALRSAHDTLRQVEDAIECARIVHVNPPCTVIPAEIA